MGLFKTKQYHCTCQSCGKEWYFTADDVAKAKQIRAQNAEAHIANKKNRKLNEAKKDLALGSFMLGGGLFSAMVAASPDAQIIPEQAVPSYDRCPFCNSKKIEKKYDGKVSKY